MVGWCYSILQILAIDKVRMRNDLPGSQPNLVAHTGDMSKTLWKTSHTFYTSNQQRRF